MVDPMTYKDVLAGVCALVMLFLGLGLRELVRLIRRMVEHQQQCPTRYADRQRNDEAHKGFYAVLENLNLRVSLLEKSLDARRDKR